jgi:hypothetical protein
MSEQAKQKIKDAEYEEALAVHELLIKRVKKYKLIEDALKQEKEELLSLLATQYDPNAKEQSWGKSFSYTPVGSLVDEDAAVAQYIIDDKDAEALYINIQERKAQLKESEDRFVQGALDWHVQKQLPIPRKPRADSFKLNKGGIKNE